MQCEADEVGYWRARMSVIALHRDRLSSGSTYTPLFKCNCVTNGVLIYTNPCAPVSLRAEIENDHSLSTSCGFNKKAFAVITLDRSRSIRDTSGPPGKEAFTRLRLFPHRQRIQGKQLLPCQ
jgi:hypothetical protein